MIDKESDNHIRQRAYAIWENAGRPAGEADAHWHQAKEELLEEREAALDEAIDESFPASDPPSMAQPAPSRIDKDRL